MKNLFSKICTLLIGAALLLPAVAQVAPSAQRPGHEFRVGLNYSNYYSGLYGHLQGPGLWLEWFPPTRIQGLGLEIEARDLNYGQKQFSPTVASKLRQDTATVGVIYRWERNKRFQPYGKFGMGLGSIDFNRHPGYQHDTRTVYAPGVGLDAKLAKHVSLRADYTYQFWPNLFNHKALTPNGVSIGALYSFTPGR